MREFMTVETFPITGRGTAHSVYVGSESPQLDEWVLLDGELCRVTGVEWPISQAGYTAILVAPVTS